MIGVLRNAFLVLHVYMHVDCVAVNAGATRTGGESCCCRPPYRLHLQSGVVVAVVIVVAVALVVVAVAVVVMIWCSSIASARCRWILKERNRCD
jgi:uncharacterized membrane-anchored protein